jgi:hypothetical protein
MRSTVFSLCVLLAACHGELGMIGAGPSPQEPGGHTEADAGNTPGEHDAGVDATSDAGSEPPDAGSQAVPEVDDAALAAFEVPGSLPCDATSVAKVTVMNAGTSTWTREGGYKLGAVGDTDPLSTLGPRIELPDTVVVLPGATWTFEVPLRAPPSAGAVITDWRMVREHIAWFGAIASATVEVECGPVEPQWPPTPDRWADLQALASQHGHLLQTNTFESCGEFIQHVLVGLNDPDWGHVGKTAGEYQHTPHGFSPQWVDGHLVTGFSHDVIWHLPSNMQVDIIGNAGANSDPNPAIWGPAQVYWGEIPREYYRINNPWLPTVPP